MILSKEELEKYIYDPNKIQQLILENVEKASEGEHVITEATNPFVMLMELGASMGANAITEPLSIVRKLYPNLAETSDELYHHLSDNELDSMFSVPAEANIVFYINVKDLKSSGYRSNGATYVETVLPKDTEVTVSGVTFTLLNNISIKLYDEGAVFVEQQLSDLDIAINSLGVLSSGVISFPDGEPWIAFETIVKQIKKHNINKALTPSEGFNIKTKIAKQYYYSEVAYKNQYTDDKYVKLDKMHTEEYINRNKPSVYISVKENAVDFKIPDVYLIDGAVSGNIKIDIYETEGKLYLPIDKYDISDFKVTVSEKLITAAESTITSIAILANSRTGVDAGRNLIPMDELKSKVINSSTGAIDVPVTTDNIKYKAMLSGFELFKTIDIVTNRVYMAAKNLSAYEVDGIYSKPDILFNTVSLTIGNLPNTNNIFIKDNYLILKSGTVFKELNNKLSVIPDLEIETLNTLTSIELVARLNETKYFWTPYYYIIDKNTISALESRIYDLDNPTISDIKIIGKNINILERVNSDKYGIEKTATGYRVYISLIYNKEFEGGRLDLVKGQLVIPVIGDDNNLYFHTDYDFTKNLFVFDIDTTLYVNVNDYLEITNGIATISNTFIKLLSKAILHIYTIDNEVVDTTQYLLSDIKGTNYNHIVVYNKEEMNIKVGSKVDYLWNKLYNTYTERLYQTYTTDIPLLYKQDEYAIDPTTGTIFECVTDPVTGAITPNYNLLHAKGDPVLDINSNPVMEHTVGEIVLDVNNLPIIDLNSGIVRNLDILMLEYEYKLATSGAYTNYLSVVKSTLNGWLFNNLPDINGNLLENTKVMYKSYKSSDVIKASVTNTTVTLPPRVTPDITIYSSVDNYSEVEKTLMVNTIGNILHEELDKVIVSVKDIKTKVIDKLGSDIVGIKIENLETITNSEIFTILDTTKRLMLNKTLELTNNNELVVKYDINLTIVKV